AGAPGTVAAILSTTGLAICARGAGLASTSIAPAMKMPASMGRASARTSLTDPLYVFGSDLHLYTLPHICAIIFRDVRQAALQLATGRLMPRRRRSRYVFHRRLRLLREGQRRSRVRRVMILSALLIFALPLMAVPAIAAESVGSLPAVDGLSSSGFKQDMLTFDRHATLIDATAAHGDHRTVVPSKSMPPSIPQPTLALTYI